MTQKQRAEIMSKHRRCIELAELHATNMQGDDTKNSLWASLQKAEIEFQKVVSRLK